MKHVADILRQLNSTDEYKKAVPHIFFERIPGNTYGNTLLHAAIASGSRAAATELTMQAVISKKEQALFLPDTFESSLSTPLILARKVGDNKTAMLLIGLC